MRTYAGEYGGSLLNPTLVQDGNERPCFPSPLVYGPRMRFDPEEFREELAEHEAAIDEVAEGILFTLRRENTFDVEDPAEQSPLVRWFDFMGSDVAVVFAAGFQGTPKALSGMKDRATCVARLGGRGIKQRLLLAPRPTEITVLVYTDRAVSLHAAGVVEAPGPQGGTVCSLRRKRLLAVEPLRVRFRRFMGMCLEWTSTPRHWLRVEVNDIPVFPFDPDTEMDMLVRLYADEILDPPSVTANPGLEHIGILSSNRRGGDEAGTAYKEDRVILPSFLADLPARVIPWKRARAVEG